MTQLDEARRELQTKARAEIEGETAYRWAARAIAAYENYARTSDLQWLRDCAHYFDEACEHAALADASGAALRAVRQWVAQYVPQGVL